MTTALGTQAIVDKLLATELGTATKPVDTAYITNIVPPPTTATPNLQQVCDTGNITTTTIEAAELGTAINPVDTAYITNIIPAPTAATPTLQEVCDTGSSTTTTIQADSISLGTPHTAPGGYQLSIEGTLAPKLRIFDTPFNSTTELISFDDNSTLQSKENHPLNLKSNSTNRIRIEANGDIAFYENTGTTQELVWDASLKKLTNSGTIVANELDVESGRISYGWRRLAGPEYAIENASGASTINATTVVPNDIWNVVGNFTATSSGNNIITWTVDKALPSGQPTYGSCRIKCFPSYDGTGFKNIYQHLSVHNGGTNSQFIVEVNPINLGVGDTLTIWLEIDQLF